MFSPYWSVTHAANSTPSVCMIRIYSRVHVWLESIACESECRRVCICVHICGCHCNVFITLHPMSEHELCWASGMVAIVANGYTRVHKIPLTVTLTFFTMPVCKLLCMCTYVSICVLYNICAYLCTMYVPKNFNWVHVLYVTFYLCIINCVVSI